jgi:hypothetical protein
MRDFDYCEPVVDTDYIMLTQAKLLALHIAQTLQGPSQNIDRSLKAGVKALLRDFTLDKSNRKSRRFHPVDWALRQKADTHVHCRRRQLINWSALYIIPSCVFVNWQGQECRGKLGYSPLPKPMMLLLGSGEAGVRVNPHIVRIVMHIDIFGRSLIRNCVYHN